MKIKSGHLAILIVILIFGSVGITSALDLWKTKNDKSPAEYTQGEFAGQADPADIRGSYSFADISKSFGIPIEDLGKAFGVKDPSDYAAFKCKDLESIYADLKAQGKEVGTPSVRYFVALYKDLPITLAEEPYLPQTAIEILKEKASLTPEEIRKLEVKAQE